MRLGMNKKTDHRSGQKTMNKCRVRYQNSPLCDENLTAMKAEQNGYLIADTGVNA